MRTRRSVLVGLLALEKSVGAIGDEGEDVGANDPPLPADAEGLELTAADGAADGDGANAKGFRDLGGVYTRPRTINWFT
jgi:hypothetical protein